VQQAEFSFRSYFELTNVARTYFYPSLTITASGGFSNVVLNNFFNPGSLIGSVTGSLAQPLFAQGTNRARLRAAQAQQGEALLNFQNTMLRAGQEVSNALFAHQTALDKMRVREYQLVALQRSLDYSEELVRYGFANYSEVLIAQQNLLSAQLGSVNDRLQQLQAVVDLYNALGGGWR
jgi:outer membrane protein TolC